MDLNEAWLCVTEALSCCAVTAGEVTDLPKRFTEAIETLHVHGIGCNVVVEWFMVSVQRRFSGQVAPRFWSAFGSPLPEIHVAEVLKASFGELHSELANHLPLIDRLENIDVICQMMDKETNVDLKPKTYSIDSIREQITLILKATVFARTSRHFVDAIQYFLQAAFRVYNFQFTSHNLDESGVTTDDGCEASLSCLGCRQEPDCCRCDYTVETFKQIVAWLEELGVLERIAGEPAMLLVHDRIEQHVTAKCSGNFDIQYLSSLLEWLDANVISWLEELFRSALKTDTSVPTKALFPAHRNRLHHYLREVYGRARIQQLFNIIVEFPESEPALLDLAECLERVPELRSLLVESLRSALEARLLHPGVNSADVLTAYVSAIRALRVLEPSGILLDAVCDPVRRYLRGRDDTVRCIVTSLTEDGSGELSDELLRAQPLLLDESLGSDDDDGIVEWETWQPDRRDADTECRTSVRHSADIISMLVNIYGSRELFVDEYRQLLADRLLTQFVFDTSRDVRHVELLKLRFGDTHLHSCEVMLKDVADSKRINARIAEEKSSARKAGGIGDNEEIPVKALIMSAQFWPQRLPRDEESPLVLPACLRQALDKFTKSFELLKGNRTLNWKSHLGLVSVELELADGRVLSYNVSPAHATVIWHFEQKPRWTIDELASAVQMPAHALRRRVAFWQSQGLLREEMTDTFVLVEDEPQSSSAGAASGEPMSVDDDEDASESAVAVARERREEELNIVWSYVVGMLTNLESLPIDRIHTMLRMFAMQGPGSQVSLPDLRSFLDRKVKEQKLISSAGVYRLPKH